MTNVYKIVLILLVVLGLNSCSEKKTKKIHYDRDMCSECKMVISDRHFAVQVVDGKKVNNFDDIGCVFTWLKENKKLDSKTINIYVADMFTDDLIEAKTAFWTDGHTTPMDFGFAAFFIKPKIEVLNFEDVKSKILHSSKLNKAQSVMKCGAGKCGGK